MCKRITDLTLVQGITSRSRSLDRTRNQLSRSTDTIGITGPKFERVTCKKKTTKVNESVDRVLAVETAVKANEKQSRLFAYI